MQWTQISLHHKNKTKNKNKKNKNKKTNKNKQKYIYAMDTDKTPKGPFGPCSVA